LVVLAAVLFVIARRGDGDGAGAGPPSQAETTPAAAPSPGTRLLRLDPGVHGTLLQSIDLDGAPTGVAVGEGSVWVAIEDGTVLKVDPLTNQVDRRFQVGTDPVAIAYGEGSVWTANLQDDTVSRIDTATGEVTTIDVETSPGNIAAGEGAA